MKCVIISAAASPFRFPFRASALGLIAGDMAGYHVAYRATALFVRRKPKVATESDGTCLAYGAFVGPSFFFA